jgi:hypothetical protein
MSLRVLAGALLLAPAIGSSLYLGQHGASGATSEVKAAIGEGQPPARSCHTMIDAPEWGGVLMFGGAEFCGRALVPDSAFWIWSGTGWERLPGEFGTRREDALLAFDSRRRVLILIGGRAGDTAFTDTWESDGKAWTRLAGASGTGPTALEHSASAFDPVRGRVVVFGGGSRTDDRLRADHWEWDGKIWHHLEVAGPPARVGHSMIWSASQQAVLLYGGFTESGSFRDLWKWDGGRWTLVDSLGPTYTEGAALMESEAGPIVVGGGLSSDPPWQRQLRVWLRRGDRWEALGQPGPRGGVGMGMAWDSKRRQAVIFGGAVPGAPPSGDTWLFARGSWEKP